MRYKVKVHRHAAVDIADAFHWASQRAPITAEAWLIRLEKSLLKLEDRPERLMVARESARVLYEVRELHFGNRPHVFRVLFTIDCDKVRVLRVRRAQMRSVTSKSLDQSFLEE